MRLKVFTAALAATVSIAAQAEGRQFDVPAGSLKSALETFAQQSGRPLIYKVDDLRSAQSGGVRGRMSAEAALLRILSGTRFSSKVDGSGAIAIVVGEDQAAVTADNDGADIFVTGTRIANAAPTSPNVTLSANDISNAGYATIGDFLATVPQNYGGSTSPRSYTSGAGEALDNFGLATSLNLRGLGNSATLTLINGHRFAAAGLSSSVDISIIPTKAVERVEIVPDGNASIYGADAVAGVANFVLRKEYRGMEMNARGGSTTEGGAEEYQAQAIGGLNWNGGGLVAVFEHYHNDPLDARERSFSTPAGTPNTLVPESTRNSGYLSLRHIIGGVRIDADAIYSRRVSEYFISTPDFVQPASSDARQLGLNLAVRADLSDDWALSVSGGYNRDRSGNDLEFFLRDGPSLFSDSYSAKNSLYYGSIDASGTLFSLPGGSIGLAFGGGGRREALDLVYFTGAFGDKRTVAFGYAETRIPVIGAQNASALARRLEFSLSGRLERYSDAGTSFSPKGGVVYEPTHWLSLRGSYSRSFRAPTLTEISGGRTISVFASSRLIPGFNVPGSTALSLEGGNPLLSPETAKSYTIGADFDPLADHSLKIRATYLNVRYRDRIARPITSLVGIIDNPVFAPFITRNPTPAQVQAFLAITPVRSLNTAIPLDVNNVSALFLRNEQNAFNQTARGVDLSADYRTGLGSGQLQLTGSVAYIDIRQQDTRTSPQRRISGTLYNVPKVRGRAGGTWSDRAWSTSLFVNYAGSVIDNSGNYIGGATNTSTKVRPVTTFDTQVSFVNPDLDSITKGMRVTLSVQNLFDRAPPKLATNSSFLAGVGYDATNASPLGRFVSLEVSRKF